MLDTNTADKAVATPICTLPGFPGQMKTLPDLYYNRYRDYDPTTGRYIQADPIGLAGDPNPYAYAMNNPLRYSDPTGQCPWCVAVGIGILAGAAEGALIDLALQLYNGTSFGCIDYGSIGQSALIGGIAGGGIGGAAPYIGRGIGALGRKFGGGFGRDTGGLDDLLNAGNKIDKRSLTKSGRALEKHGSRLGSSFPQATDNASAKNTQGQNILKEILTSKNQISSPNRFGGKDIYDSSTGRGVRFDGNGNMTGFLEPNR